MIAKTYIKILTIAAFFVVITGNQQSCKTKEGCGLEEKYAPDMEAKRGKPELFSKKQNKRMKKKT
jgi:hypothetical protein